MFAPIVLNLAHSNHYMIWYQDALEFAIKYNYPIITNEAYKELPLEEGPFLSFQKKHKLSHISESNRAKVDHYIVPDALLDKCQYGLRELITLISAYIMPIRQQHTWGYSPYLLLTALHHCHPNFACYLLEKHDVSVGDFDLFLESIPAEFHTVCTRENTEEFYHYFADTKGE